MAWVLISGTTGMTTSELLAEVRRKRSLEPSEASAANLLDLIYEGVRLQQLR